MVEKIILEISNQFIVEGWCWDTRNVKFKVTLQHQEGDIDKHDKVIITIIIRWKHGLKKIKNDLTRGAGEDAIWSWLDKL